MENKSSFGPPSKKTVFDDYIGEWVYINLRNYSDIGKLQGVEQGCLYLLPYHRTEYFEQGLKEIMIEEGLPRKIFIEEISAIHPTTKEMAYNYCSFMNERHILEILKNKRERIDLENNTYLSNSHTNQENSSQENSSKKLKHIKSLLQKFLQR